MKSLIAKYILTVTGVTIVVALFLVNSLPNEINSAYVKEVALRLNLMSQMDFNDVTSLPANHFFVQIDPNGNSIGINSDGNVYMVNEHLLTIFSRSYNKQEEKVDFYTQPISNTNLLYIIRKEPDGYRIAYAYQDKLTQVTQVLLNNIYFIIIVIYLFLLIVVSMFAKGISTTINKLREHIKDISEKNWNRSIKIYRDDEFGELASDLESMRVQLIKRDRLQTELIQNMSHDLKTPIMIIQSYLEGAIDKIYPQGTLETTLTVALEETKLLEKRIIDLIYYAKLENVEERYDLTTSTNMKDTITQVVNLLSNIKDITFETDLEDVTFYGDNEKWRIVVENILENFMRYANTKITVQLRDDFLEFFNDGALIEESMVDAIFIPYQRGQGGKFGIGLAIVYKTVSRYGYQIKARNTEHGVIFTITKKSS